MVQRVFAAGNGRKSAECFDDQKQIEAEPDDFATAPRRGQVKQLAPGSERGHFKNRRSDGRWRRAQNRRCKSRKCPPAENCGTGCDRGPCSWDWPAGFHGLHRPGSNMRLTNQSRAGTSSTSTVPKRPVKKRICFWCGDGFRFILMTVSGNPGSPPGRGSSVPS